MSPPEEGRLSVRNIGITHFFLYHWFFFIVFSLFFSHSSNQPMSQLKKTQRGRQTNEVYFGMVGECLYPRKQEGTKAFK